MPVQDSSPPPPQRAGPDGSGRIGAGPPLMPRPSFIDPPSPTSRHGASGSTSTRRRADRPVGTGRLPPSVGSGQPPPGTLPVGTGFAAKSCWILQPARRMGIEDLVARITLSSIRTIRIPYEAPGSAHQISVDPYAVGFPRSMPTEVTPLPGSSDDHTAARVFDQDAASVTTGETSAPGHPLRRRSRSDGARPGRRLPNRSR